jgi:hypothetical protein
MDLQPPGCDVIHLQHCSQYAPIIRAHNPHAKDRFACTREWFSQTNPALLAHRLRTVEPLTTVSNSVTEKTKGAFPVIVNRCGTTYNAVCLEEFRREKDYGGVPRSRF